MRPAAQALFFASLDKKGTKERATPPSAFLGRDIGARKKESDSWTCQNVARRASIRIHAKPAEPLLCRSL